jgi:CRISPR-associated protein Csb3
MTKPEPSIRINVDVTNPGQFFACCGLLELADRLWPESGVLGAFDTKCFHLFAGPQQRTLQQLLEYFVTAEVQQLDVQDNAASPLYLGNPFALRLDWWKKVETPNKTIIDIGGGHQLKPWAAKQFAPSIFRLMKNACVDIDAQSPLDEARAVYDIKDGKAKKKTTSPFYFDARRAETSLDIGFSPDEQNMSVMEYPAVESLALVGLQRFRPKVDESGVTRSFLYTAWVDPLPPSVAMAAISGMMPVRSCGMFRFTKPSRGGEYLTMFSRATPERIHHV